MSNFLRLSSNSIDDFSKIHKKEKDKEIPQKEDLSSISLEQMLDDDSILEKMSNYKNNQNYSQ